MANDRNFQQTLDSLCMLSPWMTHILVDVSGCDCWTELFQKNTLNQMNILESYNS